MNFTCQYIGQMPVEVSSLKLLHMTNFEGFVAYVHTHGMMQYSYGQLTHI